MLAGVERRQVLTASAWLLSSPAHAFENALPEVAKFSERRAAGKQPGDLGLKERTLWLATESMAGCCVSLDSGTPRMALAWL